MLHKFNIRLSFIIRSIHILIIAGSHNLMFTFQLWTVHFNFLHADYSIGFDCLGRNSVSSLTYCNHWRTEAWTNLKDSELERFEKCKFEMYLRDLFIWEIFKFERLAKSVDLCSQWLLGAMWVTGVAWQSDRWHQVTARIGKKNTLNICHCHWSNTIHSFRKFSTNFTFISDVHKTLSRVIGWLPKT